MSDKKSIELSVFSEGEVVGEIVCDIWIDNKKCYANLSVVGLISMAITEGDHWDNFIVLRRELESKGMLLGCKGCLKTVWPSGMTRNMSFGLTSNLLDEATLESSPVGIYEPLMLGDIPNLMNLTEQLNYRKEFSEQNRQRFIERNKAAEEHIR